MSVAMSASAGTEPASFQERRTAAAGSSSYRHEGTGPVQIEDVDRIDAQPFERSLGLVQNALQAQSFVRLLALVDLGMDREVLPQLGMGREYGAKRFLRRPILVCARTNARGSAAQHQHDPPLPRLTRDLVHPEV